MKQLYTLFVKGKVVLVDGTHDLHLYTVSGVDVEHFTDEKAADILEELRTEFEQRSEKRSCGVKSCEVEWISEQEFRSLAGPFCNLGGRGAAPFEG